MTTALLADTIEGYISRPNHITDSSGNILGTIVSLKGSEGYGQFARMYVRVDVDGVLFAGSCALGCTSVLLRKVRS